MTKIRVIHIDNDYATVNPFPAELSIYDIEISSVSRQEDEIALVPIAMPEYWEQINRLIENSKPVMNLTIRGFTHEMGNNSPVLPDDTFLIYPPEIAFNNLLHSVMEMTNADIVHSTIW